MIISPTRIASSPFALRTIKQGDLLPLRSSLLDWSPCFHPCNEARSGRDGENGEIIVPGSIELQDDWTMLGISFLLWSNSSHREGNDFLTAHESQGSCLLRQGQGDPALASNRSPVIPSCSPTTSPLPTSSTLTKISPPHRRSHTWGLYCRMHKRAK